MSRRMHDMTWMEYRDALAAGAAVIVPVGSTEQHGPHLPLDTDSAIATLIADRVAAQTGAIVGPPIAFGYKSQALSGGGQIFPGTTSLDAQTLIGLVRCVLAELFRHGARTVMLLSGHGENQVFLFEAADLAVAAAPDRKVLVTGWWQFVPDTLLDELFAGAFPGWDLEHAATVETALMLALDPERVRRDLIGASKVERVPPYSSFPQPPGLVPETGLLSDARPATAAMGARLIETVVAGLRAAVEAES